MTLERKRPERKHFFSIHHIADSDIIADFKRMRLQAAQNMLAVAAGRSTESRLM
jgi:hypothetical protein